MPHNFPYCGVTLSSVLKNAYFHLLLTTLWWGLVTIWKISHYRLYYPFIYFYLASHTEYKRELKIMAAFMEINKNCKLTVTRHVCKFFCSFWMQLNISQIAYVLHSHTYLPLNFQASHLHPLLALHWNVTFLAEHIHKMFFSHLHFPKIFQIHLALLNIAQ